MIIDFSIENFRSIHEELTLSMLNGRPRAKNEHLSKLPKLLKTKGILPVGMIFGGNASGKTNLLLALLNLKQLVLRGVPADSSVSAYDPYLLAEHPGAPTRFSITFLADDDNIYHYGISFTGERIVREVLELLTPASAITLFLREDGEIDPSGLTDKQQKNTEEGFLEFIATGTRPEQPFIAEARQRNVGGIRAIIAWFATSLEYISPNHRPEGLVHLTKRDHSFREYLETQTRAADLGVNTLILHDTPLDENTSIPPDLKEHLRKKLNNGDHVTLTTHGVHGSAQHDFLLASKANDRITVTNIKLGHRTAVGTDIPFDHHQESDGTRRLMELLVAFYELEKEESRRVFVIDELDRSLHPFITRLMVSRFLKRTGKERRAQLIFTTHDISLMDEDLFRHDEIIFLEKDPETCSTTLFSLDDLQLRSVKRIRAAYLNGSLGGVPRTAEIEAY